MIIDLCNDDIDQRKCPKKFLTKARGFIPRYGQKFKKSKFLKSLKNVLELVQVVSRLSMILGAIDKR